MASLKNLPPCPDNLKPMLHYIKAAIEHDNRDPVVAYWLRYHAVQLGIKIDRASKPAKLFISAVMDNLESTKKSLKGNEAVTTDMVAQAHIENYALKLFSWADAEDRAAHFDKNVVKAFYTAGLLFDVLDVWGEINEEIARQKKYAKWKAAYIHQCIKNGETPIPGPAAEQGEGGENYDDSGAGDDNAHYTSNTQNNAINYNQNDTSMTNSGQFLPPGNQQGGNTNQPFYPNVPSNQASFPGFSPENSAPKPPATLPLAPPRGAPKIQTPSPGAERKGPAIDNPHGPPLTSADIALAQKNLKYAGSALQFDDITTAMELLEKTLRLLKTGKEE